MVDVGFISSYLLLCAVLMLVQTYQSLKFLNTKYNIESDGKQMQCYNDMRKMLLSQFLLNTVGILCSVLLILPLVRRIERFRILLTPWIAWCFAAVIFNVNSCVWFFVMFYSPENVRKILPTAVSFIVSAVFYAFGCTLGICFYRQFLQETEKNIENDVNDNLMSLGSEESLLTVKNKCALP